MMNYKVYKHTSPSGKVYIGITKLSINTRWQNGNGYKDCTLFYKAIMKYGWNNIKHEILFDGLTKEEAEKIEIKLIAKYKKEGMSYNCSSGGELTALGCKRSDKFKEKLSIANKGKKMSEESKRKMQVAKKGKPLIMTEARKEGYKKVSEKMKGKIFSDEHRQHLSQAKKGKYMGAENHGSIPIYCFEIDKVFVGVKETARQLKLDPSSISKVCRGKLKHYKGYTFKYVSDVL